MFRIPQRYVQITGYAIVIMVIGTSLLSWIHARQRATVVNLIETHFASSRETLLSLTELTVRNDVTDEIKVVARDCPMRAEYETVLNTLHNDIPLATIQHAEGLYNACGDFFALRKRLMVMHMQTVFTELTTYADLYKAYTHSTRYHEYLTAVWKPIINGEVERKNLLTEQVVLQGSIISALPERQKQGIKTHLLRAQEIAESLDVKAYQLEDLRKAESAYWHSLSL